MSTASSSSAASFAVDNSCRVDDFINVVKLQTVMNSLVSRLDAQQTQIHRLEEELKQNTVTKGAMAAHAASVDERLSKIEEAIRRWTDAWGRIEEAAETIEDNAARLKELYDAQAMKADLGDFAQLKAEVHAELERKTEELAATRASASAVSSLEDSQHRILEEVVALQQLVACKIDRVEIPLLNAVSEKLQRSLAFTDEAAPRLQRLEEAAVATARVLAQKEDKEAVVQRMQHLHKELQIRYASHHLILRLCSVFFRGNLFDFIDLLYYRLLIVLPTPGSSSGG